MSAPKVTMNDEMIMGKMPKNPLVGAHFMPKHDIPDACLIEKRQPFRQDEEEDYKKKKQGREGEEDKHEPDEIFLAERFLIH